MGHQPTTFNESLSQLRRGIAVAWLANVLVLQLSIVACACAAYVGTKGSYIDLNTLGMVILISAGVAIPVAMLIILYSYFFSTRTVLSAIGGQKRLVEQGMIYNIVEEMAIAAGMPSPPKVYVLIGTGVPNAYALGGKRKKPQTGTIIVTEELGYLLNREQLQAVISHEMSHLTAEDNRVMTQLVAIASVISILQSAFIYGSLSSNNRNRSNSNSSGGGHAVVALVIFLVSFCVILAAPALSNIARAYMSRYREQQADSHGVSLCRNPTALAQALITIRAFHQANPHTVDNSMYGSPGSLALYAPERDIIESFHNSDQSKKGGMFERAMNKRRNFSATHPPIWERVDALIAMGAYVQDFVPHVPQHQQISGHIK